MARPFALSGALAVALAAPQAWAYLPDAPQGNARTAKSVAPKPGCEIAPINPEKWGGKPFEEPPEIRSSGGVLEAELNIAYADNSIAGCDVHLRSYNGRLVGPTFRVRPGDVMRIRLVNNLPPEEDGGHGGHGAGQDPNIPHGFNVTNLHTHGLHVSPDGNSDNVLLKIKPGEAMDYEIEVPADHPAGTFWYHAHVHGSTAIQVSSGMAGALIIEGGLDDVPEIAAATEHVFVMQQIAYGPHGVLESYNGLGPNEWGESLRHVTINGQIMPEIRMRPGEVQRWRFIHGGVRESIALRFQDHSFHEIAVDGIALGRIDDWGSQPLRIEPGYRTDVLVKAGPLAAGQDSQVLYLLDDVIQGENRLLTLDNPRLSSAARRAAAPPDKPRALLARIVIEGAPDDMPLPTSSEVAGLLPFEPITDAELDGEPQKVSFSIQSAICDRPGEACQPCAGNDDEGCKTRFMVNMRPFSDDNVRELKLDTASQWTVETSEDSLAPLHPFHIHVNPFEVKRTGPDGAAQTVWRDTLLIERGSPQQLRSRYEDFIGTFVLHCHILDHEDQGMMELVRIAK